MSKADEVRLPRLRVTIAPGPGVAGGLVMMDLNDNPCRLLESLATIIPAHATWEVLQPRPPRRKAKPRTPPTTERKTK